MVTLAKNLWYCMSSGKGGSVIDFVMVCEGGSCRDAFGILTSGKTAAILQGRRELLGKATIAKLGVSLTFDADD